MFILLFLLQENLKARIAELEAALDAAQKVEQRDKLNLSKLQKQLSRVSFNHAKLLHAIFSFYFLKTARLLINICEDWYFRVELLAIADFKPEIYLES